MLHPYRPAHNKPQDPPCKPTVQWRFNGRLFAICRFCPYMLGTTYDRWPDNAPWPCKAKELAE